MNQFQLHDQLFNAVAKSGTKIDPQPLPHEIVYLESDLEDILERYEHDEGVTRENLAGMYAIASDLLYRAYKRYGIQGDTAKLYTAKRLDLNAPPVKTRPATDPERPF